ncbi:MAG: hypothetical protein RJA36_1979 [Pseudomonadota bacterium]|jgi:signal transduction histidine kinase
MGRLFWKFFFAFWCAQLLTSVGVGVAIWALRPERPPQVQAPAATGAASPWRSPSAERTATQPAPPHPRHRHGLPPWIRHPVLPLVAGSIVSLIFAAALAWYFSRPIRSLRQAFDQVAGGQLDVRVGQALQGRRDELADLGQDFDRMAERLQALLEGQRRLLHDVSHELRSPLARLQAAIDLLGQQPERAPEFIARIEREAGRMDQLVGELLTLARLDAGIQPRQDEQVDLAEVVANVVEDAEFEGRLRHCRIATQGLTSALLHANRELLHRAVENVVRNALRHSPDGGEVVVALETDPVAGQLTIRVDDEGPGVPEAKLETIFQPFMRGPGANAFAGYGLGLAITRRVLDLYGGQARALNRPGGGLSVRLTLPLR